MQNTRKLRGSSLTTRPNYNNNKLSKGNKFNKVRETAAQPYSTSAKKPKTHVEKQETSMIPISTGNILTEITETTSPQELNDRENMMIKPIKAPIRKVIRNPQEQMNLIPTWIVTQNWTEKRMAQAGP
ncbi:18764_t:CDS:2 [Acaulospora morrowiae]|uniref:18764_t:CDS:1 n=1 Tax=Acaulospora morrowiae TaxID=94023 RepID=A0A9N8ZCN5_9GLOM|nr:18764_t:CDS:2 [Acaulospora morrowiae]